MPIEKWSGLASPFGGAWAFGSALPVSFLLGLQSVGPNCGNCRLALNRFAE